MKVVFTWELSARGFSVTRKSRSAPIKKKIHVVTYVACVPNETTITPATPGPAMVQPFMAIPRITFPAGNK